MCAHFMCYYLMYAWVRAGMGGEGGGCSYYCSILLWKQIFACGCKSTKNIVFKRRDNFYVLVSVCCVYIVFYVVVVLFSIQWKPSLKQISITLQRTITLSDSDSASFVSPLHVLNNVNLRCPSDILMFNLAHPHYLIFPIKIITCCALSPPSPPSVCW